jgi:hypothetical protein
MICVGNIALRMIWCPQFVMLKKPQVDARHTEGEKIYMPDSNP